MWFLYKVTYKFKHFLSKKNNNIFYIPNLTKVKRLSTCSSLKGVFAKTERGYYRLTAKNNRFWSLLILLLSVVSIRRTLLKTTNTEERRVHTNSVSCNIRLGSSKKINLVSNKLFRYYNLKSSIIFRRIRIYFIFYIS